MRKLTRRTFARLGAAALPASVIAAQPAQTDPDRERRLQWWREARFGMFIHWGLYAIPAGTWKGQQIPGIGEWIMNRAKIPVAEYEQLASRFNPVKFNAEEWVQLAKDAGMKYITITSKHHDGFAMYGSKVSRYNIVDATPFHRDPMKELAAACQKAGIKLCFYYSHAQDWHERDGAGNNWDFPPNEQKNFAKYFEEKAKPQVRELLTNYGPIGLIWFDTPQLVTKEQAQDITDMVHKLQPGCIVSGRVGHDAGDYDSAGDNQIAVGVVKRDWETPVTMNDTWGYKSYDDNWKSVPVLIKQLVRIASRGGNYLLNVGPTAEGEIPQPSVERLREVGKWLRTNSEAINGTGPSPFPYNPEWGLITTRPGKMYLHVFDYPGKPLAVYGIRSKIRKAYLLADAARKPLGVKQESKPSIDFYSATIQLPASAPDKYDSVIVLETAAEPQVVTSVTQQPNNAVVLDAYLAEVHKGAGSRMSVDRRGVIANWVDAQDWLSWEFKVFRPGTFDVAALTAASRTAWDGGHKLVLEVAGEKVSAAVNDDGRQVDPSNPHQPYVVSKLGRVKIPKAGTYTLAVRPESIQAQKKIGLALATLKLTPVE